MTLARFDAVVRISSINDFYDNNKLLLFLATGHYTEDNTRSHMRSVGRGAPDWKVGIEISAQRRLQTSAKVAQLIVSSEFEPVSYLSTSAELLFSSFVFDLLT